MPKTQPEKTGLSYSVDMRFSWCKVKRKADYLLTISSCQIPSVATFAIFEFNLRSPSSRRTGYSFCQFDDSTTAVTWFYIGNNCESEILIQNLIDSNKLLTKSHKEIFIRYCGE